MKESFHEVSRTSKPESYEITKVPDEGIQEVPEEKTPDTLDITSITDPEDYDETGHTDLDINHLPGSEPVDDINEEDAEPDDAHLNS